MIIPKNSVYVMLGITSRLEWPWSLRPWKCIGGDGGGCDGDGGSGGGGDGDDNNVDEHTDNVKIFCIL